MSVPTGDLKPLLADVAAKEEEQVEADALLLLATSAQGSLRDALVLLEQALGAGERPVTVAVARRSLGLTDPSILHALGIDPHTQYRDTLNRPRGLVESGDPIVGIF